MLKFTHRSLTLLFTVACSLLLGGCQREDDKSKPEPEQSKHKAIATDQKEQIQKDHTAYRSEESLTFEQLQELIGSGKLTGIEKLVLPNTDLDLTKGRYLMDLKQFKEVTFRRVTLDHSASFERHFAEMKSINIAKLSNSNYLYNGQFGRTYFHLEQLRIGESDLTDYDLNIMFFTKEPNYPKLRFLILTNAKITGKGLAQKLSSFKNLESVYLSGNPLDPKAEEEFRKILPKLHMDR